MPRYFKKHIVLAASAILLGILTQLLTPLSAIMEQRMIDLIVSGNMSGFLDFLWVAGAAVMGIALGYFLDGIAEKWFTAKFWESLRNDIYDGVDGENGSKLSGGERQRVALARALIRDVKVLILDEGVSVIDVATANEIEQELLDMKDLTLLTVTHRIKDGLTQQYDRIMTIKDGTVKEEQELFE